VKRTLINAASVFTGEFVVRLINFFLPILIARAYDSTALGKYSFGLACAALAALLPDLGLHLLTTREVASHPEKLKEYFWNLQTLKLLLTTAALVLVMLLTLIFVADPDTRSIVSILTLRLLLQSFSYFFMAVIKAFEQMHYLVLLQLVNFSVVFVGFGFALFYQAALPLLLCAFLPGVFCEAALGAFLVFKKFGPIPYMAPRWKQMLSIARLAFPIGLTTILIALNLRLDVIVLSWFRPSSEVGLFSAANVLSAGSFLLASLVVSVIFPKMSRLAGRSNLEFHHYVEALLKFCLFFLVPVSSIVFFGASLIVRFLYGTRYAGAIPVLQILAFSLPLIFLNAIFFYAFVARGKRSSYLWVMACGVLVNLLVNPLLTWKYGFEGTALSNLLRESLLLVLFILLSLKEEGPLFSIRMFARSAISLTVHTFLGLGLLQVGLGSVQTLLVVLTVYFCLMLLSNNFPKKRELLLLAR
jgi:O-antigen/teichoic acid export membrane protein